jgi:hypothetical protein
MDGVMVFGLGRTGDRVSRPGVGVGQRRSPQQNFIWVWQQKPPVAYILKR